MKNNLYFLLFIILSVSRCLRSIAPCESYCSINGNCYNGTCYCKPEYTGFDCNTLIKQLECNNCTGNGKYESGFCKCNEGFSGIDCSIQDNNIDISKCECIHGNCIDGKCNCLDGFVGHKCEIKSK